MAVRFIGPYRASFPLGPLQNVFTGPDRFSVESARDAYALANPSWLAQYDANRTLNIRLEYSDNDAGVAVYQIRNSTNDGWIDNSSARGITGKGVSFDNLPAGALPAVGTTPDKEAVDSGSRLLDDGMTLMPLLAVGSESVDVGAEVVLTDNAASVGFRRKSDELSRSIPSVRITSEGYQRLIRQEFKEETTIDLNTTEVEVNTNQVIAFEYDAAFEFVANAVHIRTTGEISNFQLIVQKEVDGVFKTIRNLIPPRLYEENNGGYIINAGEPQPNPKATYFERDILTGDVTIDIQDASLVEVDDDDNRITFKIIFQTTDVAGMQMSGVTADIGFGTQFYPYLRSTGYDTTRITMADRRDAARRFSEVDENTTYTTKNDFYRNRHQLSRFIGPYTLTYDTPDLWEEGDSLEVYSTSGEGTLAITGYTIDGLASLSIPEGHRYVVTFENDGVKDFVTTPVGAVGSIRPLVSFGVDSDITVGNLVPVDGNGISITAGWMIRDTINDVVIVPFDGLYKIDGNALKVSTGAGNNVPTGLEFQINGVGFYLTDEFTNPNVTYKRVVGSPIVELNAGDEISWLVTGTDMHGSASELSVFSVEYMGPNKP